MDKNIISLAKKFQEHKKNLYIVGGFCREEILGISWKNTTDIDFTTDALPDEVQNIARCIWHIWKKYGTQIIQENNQSFEITTFRSDIWNLDNRKPVEVVFTLDLQLDAQRRDFTCNAVYYDILAEKYIDPQNWIWDIEKKKLKFIWNPQERIQEDALRILRAIRFKNQYNFEFSEENYYEILEQNIHLLKNISPERIKVELDKIFLNPNNVQAWKDLKKIWFLQLFFPEMEKQSQTPGNSHHLEWDVWTHTLMTIEYFNDMNVSVSIQEKLDYYWCLFFHDVTKPMCFWEDEKWECHYYGHEKSGAEYFKNTICKIVPFSKKSQHKISWIIENHLRVFKVFEMKKLKSRKLMMHKYWPDLMIIAQADHMGRIPANFDLIEKLEIFYTDFLKILKNKKFYTGKDILEKFPDLQKNKIWEKLEQLNNQILISDDI